MTEPNENNKEILIFKLSNILNDTDFDAERKRLKNQIKMCIEDGFILIDSRFDYVGGRSISRETAHNIVIELKEKENCTTIAGHKPLPLYMWYVPAVISLLAILISVFLS